MDISVVSTFWILWVKQLWIFVYKFLFEHLFSIIWGIYLGVELLAHRVILCCWVFLDTPLAMCMRDLSSPTRDRTHVPLQWKLGVLTTGLPGNSLCLTYWGTTEMFSTVTEPFYIPTSNVWRFHILASTCYFFSYLKIMAILVGVKWYLVVGWFAFPWWLIMLNIFSYAY